MVSLDSTQLADTNSCTVIEPSSSPRISFSSDFLEDNNNNNNNNTRDLISSSPLRETISTSNKSKNRHVAVAGEHFEFLSAANSADALGGEGMITADELFFEGKLLPFWQARTAERLAKISLGPSSAATVENRKEDCHVSGGQQQQVNGSSIGHASTTGAWFVDDDPSPRPPKCTVLWKELLRLRKQRATSTLSPSSSTSSSSSSSEGELLTGKAKAKGGGSGKGGNNGNDGGQNGNVKGATRKGLERTRSATIRIRPMVNVPICSQVKSGHVSVASSLPPLFPLKKGKLFDR